MSHSLTTITSYKKKLKSLLENLNTLRADHIFLKNHNFNKPIPTEFFQKIENTKTEIDKVLAECENPKGIIEVKKKLCQRMKKRKNFKQKQIKKQNILNKRSKLHKNIDKLLNTFKRNNTEFLARKEAAQHAKIILAEINQKKFEALRYINLFKSLNELRFLRKQNERLPDSNGDIWNEKIKHLLSLWEDTLEEYNQEETKLKSVLAFNSKSLEDQWREVLFSEMECDKKVTKISNLNEFFNIRRTWDSYIVPDDISGIGSTIPSGWVLPPENPSVNWASYMFK